MPAAPVPVLLHGFLGFTGWGPLAYFRNVATALRRRGVAPLVPRLPPTGSMRERAQALQAFLAQQHASGFVLLAHSMGGLDGRLAIAEFDPDRRIRLLVTVATPHHGTVIADRLLSGTDALSRYARRHWSSALHDLSTAVRLREAIADRPDVLYQSYATARPRQELPLLLRSLFAPIEAANDGLVPARSAVWGECRATLRADHFEAVGWSLGLPSKAAGRPFDHVGFWLRAVGDAVALARQKGDTT